MAGFRKRPEPEQLRQAASLDLRHLLAFVLLGILASVVTRNPLFAVIALVLALLLLAVGSWVLTRHIKGRK